MKKVKNMAKWAIPISLAVLPVMVFALTGATNPLTPSETPTLDRIEELINTIAQFLITISLVVAVIFLVIGGLQYMFSRGDDEAVGKAKKTVWNGIIGALIVLAVGLILQFLSNLVQGQFF